jgi:hypothetical protein
MGVKMIKTELIPGPEELQELLRKYCWSRETTSDREYWTPENPAWYQCGPTAVLVKDLYGGEILMGEVIIKDPECIRKRQPLPHFWNRLPDGKEIDLTREQFPPWTRITEGKPISESLLLKIPILRQKYDILRKKVEEQIQKRLSLA